MPEHQCLEASSGHRLSSHAALTFVSRSVHPQGNLPSSAEPLRPLVYFPGSVINRRWDRFAPGFTSDHWKRESSVFHESRQKSVLPLPSVSQKTAAASCGWRLFCPLPILSVNKHREFQVQATCPGHLFRLFMWKD